MTYRDYAFQEHVEIIDNHPASQVGINSGYTRKDFLELKRMTAKQLTFRPTMTQQDVENMPEDVVRELMPFASALRPKTQIRGSIAKVNLGLPAVFATLGHAALHGHKIETAMMEMLDYRTPHPTNRRIEITDPEIFFEFQADVVAGTKKFFNDIHKKLHKPQHTMMLAMIKPLALS